MKAVFQRVTEASVHVEGEVVGQIDAGIVALVAAGTDDAPRPQRWHVRSPNYGS